LWTSVNLEEHRGY